jgi:hypothetical protein
VVVVVAVEEVEMVPAEKSASMRRPPRLEKVRASVIRSVMRGGPLVIG